MVNMYFRTEVVFRSLPCLHFMTDGSKFVMKPAGYSAYERGDKRERDEREKGGGNHDAIYRKTIDEDWSSSKFSLVLLVLLTFRNAKLRVFHSTFTVPVSFSVLTCTIIRSNNMNNHHQLAPPP